MVKVDILLKCQWFMLSLKLLRFLLSAEFVVYVVVLLFTAYSLSNSSASVNKASVDLKTCTKEVKLIICLFVRITLG